MLAPRDPKLRTSRPQTSHLATPNFAPRELRRAWVVTLLSSAMLQCVLEVGTHRTVRHTLHLATC
ncbi:hypothetical protein BVRB_1g022250 [Beta vulgaris subsp. vulgaris]|nr:hypothetical protein BVRB_1g022250 [Beta vulgaris subsp. vulgaris]